jgi:hypothetical protein
LREDDVRLSGPYEYELTLSPQTFTVVAPDGSTKFTGAMVSHQPKLYVVSVDQKPIYVGITRQPIRSRLRYGWNATGRGGYYGYARRSEYPGAHLDVWCDDEPDVDRSLLDLETVEAEVVYLIRAAGQWPRWQTEIHFHQSAQEHREAATRILAKYQPAATG